jgi:hypothetical protein
MKIYVASSWRNDFQPMVVQAIRNLGPQFEVFDLKNPEPENHGFHWSDIDPDWKQWDLEAFTKALWDPIAIKGFDSDFDAMLWANACVLVLPCGRSAHLEAGWFIGQGKPMFIYNPADVKLEPELMYRMATGIFGEIQNLLITLSEVESRGGIEHLRSS